MNEREWRIISSADGYSSVVGIYNESSEFLFGRRRWFLRGVCNQNVREFEPTTLKLSGVRLTSCSVQSHACFFGLRGLIPKLDGVAGDQIDALYRM
jgi:hypothetical protein